MHDALPPRKLQGARTGRHGERDCGEHADGLALDLGAVALRVLNGEVDVVLVVVREQVHFAIGQRRPAINDAKGKFRLHPALRT